MENEHNPVNKYETPFIYSFAAVAVYLMMCLVFGHFFIPAEWFWNAISDPNLSFKEAYMIDLHNGLNEAQRILQSGK